MAVSIFGIAIISIDNNLKLAIDIHHFDL